jgi:hypothetical protein
VASAAGAPASTAAPTTTAPATPLSVYGGSPLPSDLATPAPVKPKPKVPSSNSGVGGLGPVTSAFIFVVALLLIGGIGWLIMRDARRRAPQRHAAFATAEGSSRGGAKARPKQRKLSPAERKRRKRGRARR